MRARCPLPPTTARCGLSSARARAARTSRRSNTCRRSSQSSINGSGSTSTSATSSCSSRPGSPTPKSSCRRGTTRWRTSGSCSAAGSSAPSSPAWTTTRPSSSASSTTSSSARPSWTFTPAASTARPARRSSEGPALLLHEAHQIHPPYAHRLAYVRDPGPAEVPAEGFLGNHHPVAGARERDHEGIGGAAPATDAHEPLMRCQYLAGRELDVGGERDEQVPLRLRPIVDGIVSPGQFVPHLIDAPYVTSGDHRLDVGPEADERLRRKQVTAPVQQRTGVERVENHRLHRASQRCGLGQAIHLTYLDVQIGRCGVSVDDAALVGAGNEPDVAFS